jgi:tyrosine-protein phosphatase SIW14
MSRSIGTLVGVGVVLLCIGAPIGFAFHLQAETHNFHVVKEGVLYRSGQITLFGLKHIIHDYHIRTVVTLRDAKVSGETPPNKNEEDYCIREEINYVRLSPRHWESTEGPPPVDENVEKFRQVMSDPANYPVLVHCTAGIHRTGAYCAIYRMEHDHWSNAQAIAEVKAFGYTNIEEEEDILGYLERYQPTWKPQDVESKKSSR